MFWTTSTTTKFGKVPEGIIGIIDNKSAHVQVMASHPAGYKPLPEPVILLEIKPEWVTVNHPI